MGDTITIEIDIKKIKEDIEKYIYRKMQEAVKERIDVEANIINFPNIRYPDVEGRLEKLEDFQRDIVQGWIKLKTK